MKWGKENRRSGPSEDMYPIVRFRCVFHQRERAKGRNCGWNSRNLRLKMRKGSESCWIRNPFWCERRDLNPHVLAYTRT